MRRSFVAVASFLFVSCSDPTAPADDLVVTASVAPSVFEVGESTTVVVSVTNRGTRTRSVRHLCAAPFVVETEERTVVGPGPIYCIAIPSPPTELAPGEEMVMTWSWHGDGLAAFTTEPDAALPPGTYLLRGSVHASGQEDPVTGPPVAVSITK